MIVTVEIDDGGPAFPIKGPVMANDERGMTLRDYFAAKAMQGICAGRDEAGSLVEHGYSWVASEAYKIAEKMLETRSGANVVLAATVGDLNLDKRSLNCLLSDQIETIGDLCNKHTCELKKIPNLGKKSIKNIVEALAVHGLKLKS